MPFYNVYFETTQGELQYKVPIADDTTISAALPDLLTELQEKGYWLAGGSSDMVQVLWNGRPLRDDVPLARQGVRPSDNLRVRTQSRQAPSPKLHETPSRTDSGGPGNSSVALILLYFLVALLPIWIIEYLALVGGNLVWAAAAAVAGCGIALGLWYFSETASGGPSELIPFGTVLVALSTAVMASQPSDSKAWLMVSPALIVGVVGGFRTRKANQIICGIGGEPFSGIEFTCPRCGRTSCTSHWNPRRIRCTSCEQRDVLWLSLQGTEWWEQRLGPSITEGQCARCRSGSDSRNAFREQRDLRECGGCGMLQCRWCWDLGNGICADEQRCGWTMPDLPSAIATMSVRQATGRRR
jgi:hypothetical protein